MEGRQAKQVTTGVLLVTIGLIFLGEQLQPGAAWDFGRLWPVVLIVIGLGRLASTSERRRGSAFWFLFLGGLFLLNNYHVLRIRQSWPLFIVAGGISILMGARSTRRQNGTLDGR